MLSTLLQVAMGAACTLRLSPGGSLVIGMAAGAVSVLGYQYLSPFLFDKLSLHDTCGVHNIHGENESGFVGTCSLSLIHLV